MQVKKFGIDKESFKKFIIYHIGLKYTNNLEKLNKLNEKGYEFNRYFKIVSTKYTNLDGLFELVDVFDIDISMFFDKYRDCCKDFASCNKACIHLTRNLRQCLKTKEVNNT